MFIFRCVSRLLESHFKLREYIKPNINYHLCNSGLQHSGVRGHTEQRTSVGLFTIFDSVFSRFVNRLLFLCLRDRDIMFFSRLPVRPSVRPSVNNTYFRMTYVIPLYLVEEF